MNKWFECIWKLVLPSVVFSSSDSFSVRQVALNLISLATPASDEPMRREIRVVLSGNRSDPRPSDGGGVPVFFLITEMHKMANCANYYFLGARNR